MSWFGNLEGVGELTEEDKICIETEIESRETFHLSFPHIVAAGLCFLFIGAITLEIYVSLEHMKGKW